tara:strand:+ start:55 stop:243 length:189 start_codon:yes stop_codon:yes gene_type:complete
VSWTEDNNITTVWYEDRFYSGEAKNFSEIERAFNVIEYKFNEIGLIPTFTEDNYISTSWSED